MSEQDLLERIDEAVRRICAGQAAMRIPADQTDPDLVLADCKAEILAERAAHEETRRRLEDERERHTLHFNQLQRTEEQLAAAQSRLAQTEQTYSELQRMLASAESALEHARRELAEAQDVLERANEHHEANEVQFQQLASLLSCQPGEVVERVKTLHEAAQALPDDLGEVWHNAGCGFGDTDKLVCSVCEAESRDQWDSKEKMWLGPPPVVHKENCPIARLRVALAPSRPASEPAEKEDYNA